MFLNTKGHLFTRGDYLLGNLGVGKFDEIENYGIFNFNKIDTDVKNIFACDAHSFYQKNDGSIYGYGSNTYG